MPQIEYENPETLTLDAALLIYSSRGEIAITRHAVKDGAIQPGEPIDLAAVKQLLEKKDATAPVATEPTSAFVWRSARVIAENLDWSVWWTPPGERTVFVAGKPTKAWLPALVWAGHRRRLSLYLWSVCGKEVPTPETITYRPKFGPTGGLNHIHENSAVCLGSMSPKAFTPEGWMESFFDTNFKTNGNLTTKRYGPHKKFKRLGTLRATIESLQARGASAY